VLSLWFFFSLGFRSAWAGVHIGYLFWRSVGGGRCMGTMVVVIVIGVGCCILLTRLRVFWGGHVDIPIYHAGTGGSIIVRGSRISLCLLQSAHSHSPLGLLRQYSTKAAPVTALPHLTAAGAAHMVAIHDKAVSTRTAVAEGRVTFSSGSALSLIRVNANKKGDVLAIARISGIMAAKKCSDVVVLCHPIPISSVEVDVVEEGAEAKGGGGGGGGWGMKITAKVTCEGKTGVEMEALTAVMGAALAVVDMCKAVDKRIVINGVRVVQKTGGRRGDFFADRP